MLLICVSFCISVVCWVFGRVDNFIGVLLVVSICISSVVFCLWVKKVKGEGKLLFGMGYFVLLIVIGVL